MRLLRAAWPAFGSSCLVAFFASACGSSTGSSVTSGSGATNGVGSSGGPNLGDNLSGNHAGGSSSGGGTGALGDGEECAGTLIQAERVPLDMYVMLDTSGSMTDPTVGNARVTKWQAVSAALNDFVSDPASDGLGIGIQTFPLTDARAPTSCTTNAQCANFGGCFLKACWNADVGLPPCNSDANCGGVATACDGIGGCSKNADFVCPASIIGRTCGTDPDTGADLGICRARASSNCIVTDDCREASYAMPAVAIAPLPGAQPDIVKVLQTSKPGGLTPTGPALTGAIDQAGKWAAAHTDHQVVAVLATDGLPTLKALGQFCDVVTTDSAPADDMAVADAATKGATATPNVSTFVIGVFAPTDVAQGAPAVLDAIAKAGATGSAFIVNTKGDVAAQFRDALNKIRASGLACDLAIPDPPAGMKLNYGLVNVQFSGDPALAKVTDANACDATKGGWYYDTDPAVAPPTRILTCPVTCDALKSTDMGSVQVQLGCVTRVVK